MKSAGAWFYSLLLLLPTSVALASRPNFDSSSAMRQRIFGRAKTANAKEGKSKNLADSKLFASQVVGSAISGGSSSTTKRPLKILFLSADTGGGHRASAEALGKQFALQFPGSSYELADLWTDHGVLPYRTLVPSYTKMLAKPWRWWLFYHLSNIKVSEMGSNMHSRITCGGRIKKRLLSHDPDVIVSVHPTMNHLPLLAAQSISKQLGKHIPFFTVVTDLGSGHCMWFEKNVNKLYVASDRLYRLARRRGGTPKENIVMAGLPIRHGFAEQAEKLGDRTTPAGKAYQASVKESLGIASDKPMVLVMGGGEGVGSLSDIVDEVHAKLSASGVDATICVVCGRNEKLQNRLASKDWQSATTESSPRKRGLGRLLRKMTQSHKRTKEMQSVLDQVEARVLKEGTSSKRGNVDVVGLGFITNMPEYMVAADILVTKAGPGTIAEAASVGLPVLLTSFLPGQEAGNVDVVLESKYGDYCENPAEIASEVNLWLQDDDLMVSMSQAAQQAGNPYAADEIVADIGSQTVAWMQLNEK